MANGFLSDEMMDPFAPGLMGFAGQPETVVNAPLNMGLLADYPSMALDVMNLPLDPMMADPGVAAPVGAPPAPIPAMAPGPAAPMPMEPTVMAAAAQNPMVAPPPPQMPAQDPQQPAQARGTDWGGLAGSLSEIFLTAANEPQLAAVFRRRREAREGLGANQQMSGLQREYLQARQEGFQGGFLDFVEARSIASQSRPAGAAASGWKTQRLGDQLLRVNDDTGEVEVLATAAPRSSGGGGGGGRPRRAQIRNINGQPHWVDPYDRTATPIETPVTGSTPGPAPQTTEGERAAAGFYNRMLQAEGELLDRETPDTMDMIYSRFGDLGNYLTSPEGQVTLQKQVDWARAKLRSESGAVIGVDEARDEAANLFPRPGDSPEVIEAKQRSRQAALEQMRLKAGRATYFVDQLQQEAEDDFEPPIPQNVGADQVIVPGAEDQPSVESQRSSLMQEMDEWRRANGL